MRWLAVLPLALAGCGSALDAALEDAASCTGIVSPETAKTLAANAADPRASAAIAKQLDHIATAYEWKSGWPSTLETFDAAFSANPPPASEAFRGSVARLVGRQGYEPAKRWLRDYEGDPAMVPAVRAALHEGLRALPAANDAAIDRFVRELESRQAPVDDDLVALITAAALGSSSQEAARHFGAGFPETGAALGSKAVPPAGDPRLRRAVGTHVAEISNSPWPLAKERLARLIEAAKRHPPEPTDAYIDALVRLNFYNDDDGLVDLARPVGADRIRARAAIGPGKAAERLALQITGGPGAKYVAIVTDLETALDGSSGHYRETAITSAAAGLQRAGASAVPGLERALDSKEYAVRDVGVQAWAKIDAAQLAAALSRRIDSRRSHVNWATVQTAVRLMGRTQGEAVDQFLMRALSGYGAEVTKEATAQLTQRLDGPRFVTALFDYLERKQSFGGDEIDAYETALGYFRGVGAAVRARLGEELGAAGGKPDGVFWMLKYLAIRALERYGDAAAAPLLEKFLADKTDFMWRVTRYDPRTGEEKGREEKVIRFSEEAARALKAVRAR